VRVIQRQVGRRLDFQDASWLSGIDFLTSNPIIMISKALFSLTITLGCWLCAIPSAKAQELYFYLYNNTGRVITEAYVSPSESNMWGRNLIPYDYVYDESQLLVFIPANYGRTCYFDLKVIATDGT
jgi:hypothetical protein